MKLLVASCPGAELKHKLQQTPPEFDLIEGPVGGPEAGLVIADAATLRELYRREERYRLIAEIAADYLYMFRVESDNTPILEWFSSSTDKPPSGAELLQNWRSFIHPGDINLLNSHLERLLSGQRDTVEFRGLAATGEVRWLRSQACPIRDEKQGRITHILGAARDFTVPKLARDAALEREKLYRLFFQAAFNVMWEWDFEANKLTWSENGQETTLNHPAPQSEAEPAWLHHHIHPEDRQRVIAGMQAALVADQPAWLDEFRYKNNGSYITVIGRGYIIRNESGKPVRMMGAILDISQQKQLEAQFYQAQKMESIGRLAGGVAHDFNNLLTVIINSAEMVKVMLPDDHPAITDLDTVLKTTGKASSLTRQLLAFARRQIIEPRIINLNDLISNIANMLSRLIGENIELIIQTDPELGVAKVDPGQLEQVIFNLVVNARDAMPKGGTLIIKTANTVLGPEHVQQHLEVNPGEYVLLSISDNGCGMSDEVKAHLFEPFFTTKEKGKGTGLGLATCLGIVKQSGGHLWVYSELNQGTTVKIYLPCILEPGVSPSFSPGNVTNLLGDGSETVLLVEDETDVRNLMARTLRQYGYIVLEAGSGEEALQIVEQHCPKLDILMTDVVLPTISGKVLADQVSSLCPGIKVLFTSGYTDDVIALHHVLEPGVAFLEKPFSHRSLVRKIREVLDKPA